jgi:hypothetical protein
MPAGEGSLTSDTTRSEVDPETAPTTGLEPDTAADAAGAQETTPADENAAPDEENSAVESAAPSGASAQRTELDGPALENPEMRRATDDLRSSEEKTAQAREFSDDLVKQTGVDER